MAAIESIAEKAALVRCSTGFVSSPCISVCIMSQHTGLCLGCYRTLDEVARWSAMDDDARRAVWAEIAIRCTAHPEVSKGEQGQEASIPQPERSSS